MAVTPARLLLFADAAMPLPMSPRCCYRYYAVGFSAIIIIIIWTYTLPFHFHFFHY